MEPNISDIDFISSVAWLVMLRNKRIALNTECTQIMLARSHRTKFIVIISMEEHDEVIFFENLLDGRGETH